jgi:hypothetical protein
MALPALEAVVADACIPLWARPSWLDSYTRDLPGTTPKCLHPNPQAQHGSAPLPSRADPFPLAMTTPLGNVATARSPQCLSASSWRQLRRKITSHCPAPTSILPSFSNIDSNTTCLAWTECCTHIAISATSFREMALKMFTDEDSV